MKVTLVIASLFVTACSTLFAQTLSDDFEAPSIGSNPYQTYYPGDSFGAWQISSGNSSSGVSASYLTENSGFTGSPNGGQFHQLTDSTAEIVGHETGGAFMTRGFTLDAGVTYQLSFFYNSYNTANLDPFTVGFNNSLSSFSLTGLNDYSGLGTVTPWATGTLDYTALYTGMHELKFGIDATTVSSNAVLLLDHVSVSPVPEPSSGLCVLLAALRLATVRRRSTASR